MDPQKIVHRIIQELEADTLRRMLWHIIEKKLTADKDEFINKFLGSNLLTGHNIEELYKPNII